MLGGRRRRHGPARRRCRHGVRRALRASSLGSALLAPAAAVEAGRAASGPRRPGLWPARPDGRARHRGRAEPHRRGHRRAHGGGVGDHRRGHHDLELPRGGRALAGGHAPGRRLRVPAEPDRQPTGCDAGPGPDREARRYARRRRGQHHAHHGGAELRGPGQRRGPRPRRRPPPRLPLPGRPARRGVGGLRRGRRLVSEPFAYRHGVRPGGDR